MGTISWNESNPPDTASAGLGDDEFRSLKTSLRIGLDDEHVWPSAGGDAGVHRRGSAKVYVGTQSTVSSSGTDGKLMLTSDTSRLFAVGSGGTALIGGTNVISAGSTPGGSYPQRYYWAEEFGIALASDGSAKITIPNSGYSGLPYIFASLYTTTNPPPSGRCITVIATDASSFSAWVTIGSSQDLITHAFVWRSLGSRVL